MAVGTGVGESVWPAGSLHGEHVEQGPEGTRISSQSHAAALAAHPLHTLTQVQPGDLTQNSTAQYISYKSISKGIIQQTRWLRSCYSEVIKLMSFKLNSKGDDD